MELLLNIALIPARGGSKRIPRKNIKPFLGKPLIAYSIETALASGCFDHVIVSTDDEEVATVAKRYGASVPFMRPKQLADDFSPTLAVIQHAIAQLDQQYEFDAVCCIYATAPLLRPEDIQKGLKVLTSDNPTYTFSATEFDFPVQRGFTLDGELSLLMPEHQNTRSQDLPTVYHDAGQFYWGKKSTFAAGTAIFSPQSRPIVLPKLRVQDIDTQRDWDFAEALYKYATS